MRDLIGLQQESMHPLLQEAIRLGDTLMSAQVLEPRFDEESFHEAARFGSIFEDATSVGAIPATLSSYALERDEKGLAVFHGDAIFDHHHGRAGAFFQVLGDDRCGPVHGWRQIESGASVQFPPPCQWNGEQGADTREVRTRWRATRGREAE